MNNFNVQEVTANLIQWIKNWFEENGKNCNAIIGISGGKDSTIVAKLCCEAIGSDRVIGILMPCGEQKDISYSKEVCKILGIRNYEFNIGQIYKEMLIGMDLTGVEAKDQSKINLAPRLRMSTLYMYSQSLNGRVANTCNLSEEIVGYSTRWGDSVGDFSPLGNLTVTEVLAIGDYLGLPYELVHKVPIDGLNVKEDGSYVTDEDNLGISYSEIDKYIRGGHLESNSLTIIQNKIKNSSFKRKPIPTFKNE